MAARSEAWFCDISLAGIVGLNIARGIDVCPLCLISLSQRWTDHSSRGVSHIVVCPSVILTPRPTMVVYAIQINSHIFTLSSFLQPQGKGSF